MLTSQVHEIWHFPDSSSTLFTDYINKFLKVKQKTDGWPADVGDDKEKHQKYIHNYHSDEGVLLEYDNIEQNPAKCASAKLMLNSFWGKFGKQSNKCQVDTFGSPAKFYQPLNNDELPILRVSGQPRNVGSSQ